MIPLMAAAVTANIVLYVEFAHWWSLASAIFCACLLVEAVIELR